MGGGRSAWELCDSGHQVKKRRLYDTDRNLQDNRPNIGLSTSLKEYVPPESGDSKKGVEHSTPESPKEQPSIQQPTPPSSFDEELAAVLYDVADSTSLGFPWPRAVSRAKEDWDYQKSSWNMSNTALDSLMEMIGLELVKAKFVEINTLIATAIRQGVDYSNEKFGAVFIGNPGTGKTTVAKLYADFLYAAEAIPLNNVEITTGTRLASGGVQGCRQLLDDIETGGVLLVDEAHQMVSSDILGGSAVLDLLLSEVENLAGKVAFIFTGYGKQMEAFASRNPAFPSLIPTTIKFPDYHDAELHLLLVHELKLKFGENMKVEGGYNGPFMRIVVRCIGRGRGKYGFGNAREVQNVLSRILRRQASRLFRAEKAEQPTDDLLLTREDLIGPPPSSAFVSKAWKKLQGMIGLRAVKDAVETLIHRLQLNYERELAEKPLVECSLNKLFLGNPGTGKTTVAKLYGEVLTDIGLLSNGEVVVKTPPDFIGDALGQSERNTKAILDSTRGKVLIIDEAYMLGGGGDRSTPSVDSFRTAVTDTIVGEVQSTAVEDRCVILLGYKDRMESMLNDVNPALARRFPLASAFVFEDYSTDELRQILNLKLHEQGFRATKDAKSAALEVLGRARNRPGFGNAAEVDILLDQAKVRQHRRLLECPGKGKTDLFEPRDIDEDFDRGGRALGNIRELFSDFVGCESLIGKLEGYQLVVRNMKTLHQDPREEIPFSFLFRGPPGTGKTTTAKRMGAVFYEMGFLATKDVVECSATDLIGEYIGQTGPKTKRLFESALGRVLFIDEAYKLGEGPYGKEAMIEMVNSLTKDRYHNKLVTILAGYEHDINKLMAINPGLTSRFPEVISFNHLSVSHCIELLLKCLKSKGLDTSTLECSRDLKSSLEVSFEKLSILPSWGNARDIQTLAKAIFSRMMRAHTLPPSLVVPEEIVVDEIMAMSKERRDRAAAAGDSRDRKTSSDAPLRRNLQAPMRPPPTVHIKTNTDIKKIAAPEPSLPEPQKTTPVIHVVQGCEDTSGKGGHGSAKQGTPPKEVQRDPGVSDEEWDKLQLDKQGATRREMELGNSRDILALLAGEAAKSEAVISTADPASKHAERWRQRLKEVEEKLKKLKKALEEKEETARKEKQIQECLKIWGNCPLGYDWIKQEHGYRCSGGTHFVTFEQLREENFQVLNDDWS